MLKLRMFDGVRRSSLFEPDCLDWFQSGTRGHFKLGRVSGVCFKKSGKLLDLIICIGSLSP